MKHQTEFGEIPIEWQVKQVIDIKNEAKRAIAMGPFGSNIKADNFVESGVPVIRGTNMNFAKFVDGEFVFLTEEKADELLGSNCQPNDLVFTHRGTIGQVALIPENKYPRYVISQSGMKLTVNHEIMDSEFLFYFFKSEYGQYQILKYESQVGVPSISNPLTSLKEMCVPVPPLLEQKAIASVLSSLDDKIDLLHRQNKILEAMAETLLIQHVLPREDEQNDGLYLLGDYLETISVTHKFPNPQVVFLNTSDIYKGKVLIHELSEVKGLPGQAKKSIKKGDILFSEIRPANGRYALIDFDADNYVVSTKLMVLRAKQPNLIGLLYFYLTNKQVTDWLQVLAESRSGTFPQITFDQVADLELRLPQGSDLDNLIGLLDDILLKQSANNKQIQTLENLRDTLLPKLMSGEVRVQYQTEEVA
ncbi:MULTISPECIES: restriction endonuclease subunit S [Acinetobacter]|uniref:Restriction endonuclease subunit S n=1 Tax=Acinetobacter corruptisaponis TaxID=3045147 RepID=A0ABY8SBQ4_9GAMM|nr:MULTISPECIES: restriction endonuclease subunit S [Acinetobacter]MCU4335331.1 restriction endonuclease subunit S [Acinetobacter pittii]WHP07964.1 restriction endonuclease subunit S [Acinetobacter sp. KCTC 92772]